MFENKILERLPALRSLERIAEPSSETLRACVLELTRLVLKQQGEINHLQAEMRNAFSFGIVRGDRVRVQPYDEDTRSVETIAGPVSYQSLKDREGTYLGVNPHTGRLVVEFDTVGPVKLTAELPLLYLKPCNLHTS